MVVRMSEIYKDRARHSVARIRNSIFSTLTEQANAAEAATAVENSLTLDQAQMHLDQIEEIFRSVTTREAGTAGLSSEHRREVEQSLDLLESRLADEIRERKVGHRHDLRLLLTLLAVCIFSITGSGTFLLVHGVKSAENNVAAGTVFAAIIGCTIVIARIIQNSREAAERLDEKLVAVRFLRMALHPSWASEMGIQLIAPAVAMFIQHFAPTSATLGADDTAAIIEGLKP
jgi:hypothetical protein